MICEQCKRIVQFVECVNGRDLCTSCFVARNVPTPGDGKSEVIPLSDLSLGSIRTKSIDLRFVRGKDGSLVLQQKWVNLDNFWWWWEDVPVVEELVKKAKAGSVSEPPTIEDMDRRCIELLFSGDGERTFGAIRAQLIAEFGEELFNAAADRSR